MIKNIFEDINIFVIMFVNLYGDNLISCQILIYFDIKFFIHTEWKMNHF